MIFPNVRPFINGVGLALVAVAFAHAAQAQDLKSCASSKK
jgi:hypothetical protein